MTWFMAALAVVALVASGAVAQERPAVRPSDDVAVVYRVQGTNPNNEPEARTVRMFWTGQGSRMRMEMEGQPGFALVDFVANRMTMVLITQQSYLQVPFDPQHAPGLDIPAGVTMTRSGTDRIAGTPCTLWDMRGQQGSGTACIAGDGLLLRVSGLSGGAAALEAVSVSYGAQPASLFALPAGLHPLVR